MYEDLFKYIAKTTDDVTKKIDLPSKELLWDIKFYADVCHSGSSVDAAKEWCSDNKG